jgi:hypothetical protein
MAQVLREMEEEEDEENARRAAGGLSLTRADMDSFRQEIYFYNGRYEAAQALAAVINPRSERRSLYFFMERSLSAKF